MHNFLSICASRFRRNVGMLVHYFEPYSIFRTFYHSPISHRQFGQVASSSLSRESAKRWFRHVWHIKCVPKRIKFRPITKHFKVPEKLWLSDTLKLALTHFHSSHFVLVIPCFLYSYSNPVIHFCTGRGRQEECLGTLCTNSGEISCPEFPEN